MSTGGLAPVPTPSLAVPTAASAASGSRVGTAPGKLKGPAHKLATRKLAAALRQVASLVADARSRAVRLESPRNLLEFTLATFSDDEVT